jgi:hypothetical protein
LLGDELRRPPPVPLDCVVDRQCLQLVSGKGVRIRGLPGLDLNPGDSLGVGGCPGANQHAEPTLPG